MKYLPKTVGIFAAGAYYRDVPITRVVIHAPGTHKHSAIKEELYAVEAVTHLGSRWYGTKRASINSELRVVMDVNPGDEVLAKWATVQTP